MNEARPHVGADALVLTAEHRVEADDLDGAPLRLGSPEAAPTEDEAALRALVAEVLREELRGALGRDVTRGVRKLVRQEVGRVLATRDLERR